MSAFLVKRQLIGQAAETELWWFLQPTCGPSWNITSSSRKPRAAAASGRA